MAINGHQLVRYSMMASDGHRIFINGLLRSLGSRHLVRCCKCKRFTSLLYSLGHRCPVRDYGQRPPRHRPCRVSRPTSLIHTLGYRYHVWGHKHQRPTSLVCSLGRRRQVWGPGYEWFLQRWSCHAPHPTLLDSTEVIMITVFVL